MTRDEFQDQLYALLLAEQRAKLEKAEHEAEQARITLEFTRKQVESKLGSLAS